MKTKKLILTALILIMGVHTSIQAQEGSHNMSIHKAICVLYPTEGNKTMGTVTFEHVQEGVKVV
ncbi:MAG: superoxide dismutase family protein, partial [Bacteroidetes bacterium]|nr:superoxide dismutase family protein [Bacteroidota bacterium]